MSELISVTVADGKYTIQEKEAYRWECLRYGEPWSAYEGTGPNNLEIALAHEVDRLKKLNALLEEEIQGLYEK